MDTNNMISLLESLMPPTTDEVAAQMAADFRRRRIEKNITRQQMADRSGVPAASIARFEQKGLISLKNLIELAISLGYINELRTIFASPKYDTMDELLQIRKNTGKKKASGKNTPQQ